VELGRLVAYLNELLQVNRFDEAAINGLQVAGRKKISRVAFAVDGVLETFERAVAEQADFMVVHHGLYWGHQWALRGPEYKRVKVLMDAEMGLYAAHLPLDAHQEFGHAAQLLLGLGASNLQPFGRVKEMNLGWLGEIEETERGQLTSRLSQLLQTTIRELPFGPERVRRVACVTGQGAHFPQLREAKIQSTHYYISGEASHPVFHYCKEAGITLALGGHYATEVLGLHALARNLREVYALETVWIDAPTGF
jgi:dinuclear metal center YbgI/SA1388 family protein